jgi:hypothetical protein
VTVHPGEVWAVRYTMSTARDMQGFGGLDSTRAELPAAAAINGLLRTASGVHQEIGVSRKIGGGVVQASLYRDVIDHSTINGTGMIGAADLLRGCGSSAVVADTATGRFQCLGMGYTARGVNLMVSQPVASDVWATLEYRNGAALSARDGVAVSLPQLSAGMRAVAAEAATAALQAKVPRAGTRLEAAYRWQPGRLLTPVGSYEAFSDQAFLSCYVRQSLRWGNRLPPGLDATINVTNLLAQGYQPFLSADGRTLYLAQAPRTLQAGLSFTF